MDKAVLFPGNIYIYWHGVFMVVSIMIAIISSLIFCSVFHRPKKSVLLRTIVFALPLGIVFSRTLYCISNFEEFKGLDDILGMTDGGYALYGGILGVFFAAVAMHLLNPQNSISTVCDCMAIGGALGIAAGRMASYFSYDNVGIVITDKKYCFFPLSVYDPLSNQWFLATFTMEAIAELIIFIVLCVIFVRNNNEKEGMRGRSGDIALLFLMMHGAAESLFDSMHTAALRFPGNNFIRLQQLISAICLVVTFLVFIIRSVKLNRKFKLYHFVSLVFVFAMIGICVFIEQDRISDITYLIYHLIMFTALLATVIVGLIIYQSTLKKPDNNQLYSNYKNI